MKRQTIALLGAFVVSTAFAAPTRPAQGYYHAPAWNQYIRIDPNGVSIMPNGRLLTPRGKLLWTSKNAYVARLNPADGSAFCASGGGNLLIAENPTSEKPTERRLKRNGAVVAVAFSPDGKRFYWSGGDDGSLLVFEKDGTEPAAVWNANGDFGGKKFVDSYLVDMAPTPDGRFVHAADITNFRIVTFDAQTGKIVSSLPAGRYPYALALSKNGKKLFVANIGVFEYQAIKPPKDDKHDKRGLTRPAFGYLSKEARDGVEFEGRWVDGLGDPNLPDSFSVWAVDVSNPAAPKVQARIKTGVLVNYPYENGRTVTGSAPSSLALFNDRLYVSNGNNDTIDVIDINRNRIIKNIRLRPQPELSKYRGVTPYGLVVSPNGKRLYVCEAGINAVAVIDTATFKVLGHIPAGWYPNSIDISKDGKTLVVANAKGIGQGPKSHKVPPRPEQAAHGALPGALQVMSVPTDAELPELTQTVLANNGLLPSPERLKSLAKGPISPLPSSPSQQIKYVVFITKENHTFDGVLGDLEGAKRDVDLAWWGKNRKIEDLENVHTMPNHLKLAQEFATSDNFYMEPEASGDGHRWLVGAYPNIWCQRVFETGWSFRAQSPAPGRRVPFGSNGSIAPEDYLESGSLWEHLDRGGIPFRNYGEGFEFAGVIEGPGQKPTGAREVVNIPMPNPLFENTCFEYPIYNTNIPDQYRADQFIKDLETNFRAKGKPLPRFLNAAICNDHGDSPRKESGYPYVASYLADNDLALGRMVEWLSHQPEWKNMVIFVTQDDPGGDPDHIDRHRSICLMISPWVKRGYISNRHTSISSIIKTIYLIFGLPPCNLYDAVASDLTDAFTLTPDYRPYKATAVDKRIFDPEKARDPADPEYKKAAMRNRLPLDDPEHMEKVRPNSPLREEEDEDE